MKNNTLDPKRTLHKYHSEDDKLIVDKSIIGRVDFIGTIKKFNDDKYFVRRIVLDTLSLKNSHNKNEFEFLLIAKTPKQKIALEIIHQNNYIIAELKHFDTTTNYDRDFMHAYEIVGLIIEE